MVLLTVRLALQLAQEKRDNLKGLLTIAQSEVKAARDKLMSFLDADQKALPLMEWAARQHTDNGEG